jgi:hypothetical protein
MTYEIDPSGRLRPPVTQRMSKDLHTLAGEPQGRFVYAEHGGWTQLGGVDGSDGAIVSYAPDPRDGTLVEVSERTVFEHGGQPCTYCSWGGWQWLKGGANRVHGFWLQLYGSWGQHAKYTYVSIPVASDGYLGPVSRQPFEYEDEGSALVDVRANVLYKAGSYNERGGLEAHLIEPDGTLTRMGWTNLCLASPMGFSGPLVTARGFLFSSFWNRVSTVCAYQGLRLKPLYALDLAASVADAFVPSSEDQPVLVAMGLRTWTGREYRSALRIFSMNHEGDLRQMYAEDLPDYIEKLLFHPSGRSLYTVDRIAGLRVYTIDPEGRIELAMNIEHGGGSMAITLKDARPEAQNAGQ